MTQYEDKFTVPVAFPPDTIPNCLGEVLSASGKTQFRIAETYKYAHITYFFNGYREPAFKNEYRILIPSLSSPHPEEHPEMMAKAITDRLLETIQGQAFDFVLANYANADTMGHTANFDAGVAAVKALDHELGRILKTALETNTILVITSDHGNIERMIDPNTGAPESQHDPSPVPCFIVSPEFKGKKFLYQDDPSTTSGMLADVAPTVLELMKIPKPPEMNGRSLLRDLM